MPTLTLTDKKPISVTTNLQNTVTAKNAITLLLKEMISLRFDQNLPQGEN
jgi:hypothetical protein